jgi:hypothetical protein
MGIADEKAALKLNPENADDWDGILHNWDGVLDPRLTAPVGVRDWEVHSTALTVAENAIGKAAEGDGCNLLEACGLVPYERGDASKNRTEKAPVYHLPVRGQ